MPKGTIKPGNRDFSVSSVYQELMDGVSLREPSRTPPMRTGQKIYGKDGLFTYYIPPGTDITEKNGSMFEHNMHILSIRAERIKSGSGTEKKE